MITRTTLEDLSVELFYEIFSYFQFHELSKIFSNVNGRFAGIVNNMLLTSVHLGLSGMSVSVAEFYYRHLLQSNVCNRVISLCVSDTFAVDNGLWVAKHFNTFTNLRHLSLIDMKRTSFELFLKTYLHQSHLWLHSSYDIHFVIIVLFIHSKVYLKVHIMNEFFNYFLR